DEAVAAWEKGVRADREGFGKNHKAVVASLQTLARMHEERWNFAAAQTARQEVLAIRVNLYGAKDWRVTDARLDLEDVKRLAQLKATDRQRLQQATALNQQVFRLGQVGRSQEALPLARQALAIRKELLGEAHPDYATSL